MYLIKTLLMGYGMLLCFGGRLNHFLTVLHQVGPSITRFCFPESECALFGSLYYFPSLWLVLLGEEDTLRVVTCSFLDV